MKCMHGNMAQRSKSGKCLCNDCKAYRNHYEKLRTQKKPRDRSKESAYWKEFYAKPENKEKWYTYNKNKKRTEAGKVDTRDRNIRNKYGISLFDYNDMYALQCGKCKICGLHQVKLVIDHCHATDTVRGLLCTRCNTLTGYIQKKPEIIPNIIDYIKSHDEYIAGRPFENDKRGNKSIKKRIEVQSGKAALGIS